MSLRLMLPTEMLSDPHACAQFFANQGPILGPQITAFDVPGRTTVGTSPNGWISVYYDNSLPSGAAALAQDILARGDQTFAACQAFFGITGEPVNVLITDLKGATDGSGGGKHDGCDFNSGGNLYCDAAIGNPDLTNGIVVAELTECFMGAQQLGWYCNQSNGEALSRFLAQKLSGGPNGSLRGFTTGPKWYEAGRPDYVRATYPTDTHLPSIGCGVVYLYWMLSKGYTYQQITQAGCPSTGKLSANYKALTGSDNAWADFQAAVSHLNGPITSDDPWGGWGAAPQIARVPTALDQLIIDVTTKTVRLPAGWRVANAPELATAKPAVTRKRASASRKPKRVGTGRKPKRKPA
jgi:hypothetical protein